MSEYIVKAGCVSDDARQLLMFLEALYPSNQEWLRKVDTEIRAGRCDAFETHKDGRVVAVAFGTLKDDDRYKVRTIFVAAGERKRGVGKALMTRMVDSGRRAGATEIYVTAATSIGNEFALFAESLGFTVKATVPNRYGEGRDENVYSHKYTRCRLALGTVPN